MANIEDFAQNAKKNGKTPPNGEGKGRTNGEDAGKPSGKIRLWKSAPLKTARTFIEDRYTLPGGIVTIHCYQGDFYVWDGAVYRRLSDAAIRSLLYEWLDNTISLKKEKNGEIVELAFNPNSTSVSEVEDALRAQAHLEADIPSWLGSSAEDMPDLAECIITRNGVVRLPTGEEYQPSAELFSATCMPVMYNPDARKPEQWLKFLGSIWTSDAEAIKTLQQIFGYLLTPSTIHQKLFLIVGPPRSGKGTIARILTAILGNDSVANPTLASLEDTFGLQPLIGKTVGIISDARLSGKTDQAQVTERLLSISGEDNVTIGRKHKIAWEGRMRVRFLLFSNELPRLADASGALASRFVILQMQNSFLGREDTELEGRLMCELPDILNWAIDGWRDLKKAGKFIMPASSREAVESLGSLSSPIKSFIDDTCIILSVVEKKMSRPFENEWRNRYVVPSLELFGLWQEWCKSRGRFSGSDETFGRDLKSALTRYGIMKRRLRNDPRNPNVEGKRAFYWVGIKLRIEANQDEEALYDAEIS